MVDTLVWLHLKEKVFNILPLSLVFLPLGAPYSGSVGS